MGSVVGTKLSYDACVQPMSKKACRQWRTRISRAVLGGGGSVTRCNESVFNLFTKGHQVDPWQGQIYESILTTREQLLKYPQLRTQLQRCCHIRREPTSPKVWAGPAGQFLSSLGKVGWVWADGFNIITSAGLSFDLLTVDSGFLKHILREDMRHALWQQAGRHGRSGGAPLR